MRVLVALSLLLTAAAGPAASFTCRDLLSSPHPKSYFSLLFEAAGGQFVTESERASSEGIDSAQSSVQGESQSEFPELIPFEDVVINELALRMRMIMMNAAFKEYRQRGTWAEFESRILRSPTSFDYATLVWAAFTISALNGDLSLASPWITDHLQVAFSSRREQRLVLHGLKYRMWVYQAADEVLTATIEWESEKPPLEVSEKLLNWPLLTEALTQEELFLMQQALSWTPNFRRYRPELTPQNLQASIDILMMELATGTLKTQTLSQVERFLSSVITCEEELLHSQSISMWPAALEWLKLHEESGALLVQDVMEFRKFYPDIR